MYKLVADPEYPVGAPISQEGYISYILVKISSIV